MTMASKITGTGGSGSIRIPAASSLCIIYFIVPSGYPWGPRSRRWWKLEGAHWARRLRADDVERTLGFYRFPSVWVPYCCLTNCHKHSGFKRQKSVIWQLWGQRSNMSLTRLKWRCHQGCTPFWSFYRKVHLLAFCRLRMLMSQLLFPFQHLRN